MKMLEYETANPGADFDELERQHFDPAVHGSRPPTTISIQGDEVRGPEPTGPAKGRQRRTSVLKGGRKDGFAAAREKETEKEESTDVYDAAPGVEAGDLSHRA